MGKILTVRLKAEEERILKKIASELKRSQSDIVREAIMRYAKEKLQGPAGSAADRLKPWTGIVDSGGMDLSTRTGRKFAELLEQRKRDRRPR